jgi:hypothetical protein
LQEDVVGEGEGDADGLGLGAGEGEGEGAGAGAGDEVANIARPLAQYIDRWNFAVKLSALMELRYLYPLISVAVLFAPPLLVCWGFVM